MKRNMNKYYWLILISFLLISISYTGWYSTFAAPQGSTIVVTTRNDELNTDGDCSLREAIRSANLDTAVDQCTAGNGADTILLTTGTYKLSLSNNGNPEDQSIKGDLDITDDVVIEGISANDTLINGNQVDRVFHILGGSYVTIKNLTIKNGNSTTSGLGGGGILVEGSAQLSLSNIIITSNQSATVGGGIDNFGGSVIIIDSIIQNNQAKIGGGIFNDGTLDIYRTLIAYNTATGSGTDVDGGGLDNAGEAYLENTTISNNSAPSGSGGGVFNDGLIEFLNVTIAENDGGGFVHNAGAARFKNSLVAKNTTFNCSGINKPTSLGNNLENTDSCNFNQTSDLVNVAPNISALQDNDGFSYTHALLSNSPAIDSGDNLDCPDTDQRTALRPADGNQDDKAICDIGAFEYNAIIPMPVFLPVIYH